MRPLPCLQPSPQGAVGRQMTMSLVTSGSGQGADWLFRRLFSLPSPFCCYFSLEAFIPRQSPDFLGDRDLTHPNSPSCHFQPLNHKRHYKHGYISEVKRSFLNETPALTIISAIPVLHIFLNQVSPLTGSAQSPSKTYSLRYQLQYELCRRDRKGQTTSYTSNFMPNKFYSVTTF